MPVPKVTMTTRPATPLPAPHKDSAIPAASASLTAVTGNPVADPTTASMLVPTQLESTLTAVRAVPPCTTAGKVQPSGPCQPYWSTISATTSATAPGVAGWGVRTL